MSPSTFPPGGSDTDPASTRFSNCALVEIIHLHDCLRNALSSLQSDVLSLQTTFQKSPPPSEAFAEAQRQAEARFKVIWSVFQAHSKAEDEYIWPKLKEKQQQNIKSGRGGDQNVLEKIREEEYEEDHQEEEQMFQGLSEVMESMRRALR